MKRSTINVLGASAMKTYPARSTMTARARLAVRAGALLTCMVFGIGMAAAECSQKARALGKCPPTPHATAKSKFAGRVAGTTPLAPSKPQPVTEMRRVSPLPGPSPIQHADKNALNPQPIPPGHPVHPLSAHGELREGGG